MKRVFGVICMVLGIALVVGAAGLMLYNQSEEKTAQKATDEYLPKVIELINEKTQDNSTQADSSVSDTSDVEAPETSFSPIPEDAHHQSGAYVSDMLVAEIEGYDFIGYVSIPKLGLQLPVMSETDMDLMRIAPCRFSGSPKTNNLVVGAHNYSTHFGTIDELAEGDSIVFADMEGNVWKYSVAYTEILLETDVDELQNSGFPLTLYTCTYDGESRITVRCE